MTCKTISVANPDIAGIGVSLSMVLCPANDGTQGQKSCNSNQGVHERRDVSDDGSDQIFLR